MKQTAMSFLAGVLLLGGCHRANDKHLYSGTLELTEHSVGARVGGRLAAVYIDEGSKVTEGQLIATLDRAKQTERDYERAKNLFEHGGATKQALEEAQLAWEDQRVVSPLDGIVLIKVRESGEVLTAGSAVAVIGDERDMWVRIFIPEGDVSQIQMNEPVTVRVDGLDQSFKGHVSYVAPRGEFTPRNVQTRDERATQTFAVKVALDERAPNLRPGVAADVQLSR